MQRALLICTALLLLGFSIRTADLRAQTNAKAQIGKATLSTVEEWNSGTLQNLIASNNNDGELRLAENATNGVFTSPVFTATTTFNAIGALWNATVPQGTRLSLEVRGGPSPDQLGEWQAFTASDAQSADSGALALETVRAVPNDSTALQFRATFDSTVANASPVLSDVALHSINAVPGQPREVVNRTVPAAYGPATLTAPPQLVPRTSWDTDVPDVALARQAPRGVILHQLGAEGAGDNPLPFLRALSAYHRSVLGWDDLAFHFLIDNAGNVYEGRVGGPTAALTRLAGGDIAVHVALMSTGAPTAEARAALVNLLAWLGQAYDMPPLGEHQVLAENGEVTTRPNVVTHSEVVPAANDPSEQLIGSAGALRQAADQGTVRARWYFAEGNTMNFSERLAVLNPGATPANVRFLLLREPGPTRAFTATLEAGARRDLVINTIFSDTTDVPAIIESNAPVLAERYMDFTTDIAMTPGVTNPSRVWYFAAGSTSNNAKTFLVLFNPQRVAVDALVTYMKSDGATAEQPVAIPAERRVVVVVGNDLKDADFGMRVVATQPIVAERTLIFGPDSTLERGGFASGPGVSTLARRWYFAEGTTQALFQMIVYVLNPNAQRANVAVTFATSDGTFITRKYAMPPTTRLAIDVNEVVPELGIATSIEADRPVVAERAMYWKDGNVGTLAAGAAQPAFVWRFVDGRTSGDYQQYLLFSNPNQNQARVTVDFLGGDGSKLSRTITMPGNARYTMAVHEIFPGQNSLAATVRSTQPIVAERSLYPGAPRSDGNRGGATTLGLPDELR